jgi:small-conductance mechanosensitive channel
MKQKEDRTFYVAEFVMPFLSYVPTVFISVIYIALSSEKSEFHIFIIPLLVVTLLVIFMFRVDILLMFSMPGYLRNFVVSTAMLAVLPILLLAKNIFNMQHFVTAAWLLIIPVLLLWAWLMSYGKTAKNAKNQYRSQHSNNRFQPTRYPRD